METHKFTQIAVFLEVRRMIWSVWPSASVRLFGSCTTDLSLPYSDIDIVIQPINPKQIVMDPMGNMIMLPSPAGGTNGVAAAGMSCRSPSMDSISNLANSITPRSYGGGVTQPPAPNTPPTSSMNAASRARAGSWSVSSTAGSQQAVAPGAEMAATSISARTYSTGGNSHSHIDPSKGADWMHQQRQQVEHQIQYQQHRFATNIDPHTGASSVTAPPFSVPPIDLSTIPHHHHQPGSSLQPTPTSASSVSRQQIIEGLYALSNQLFEQPWATNLNPIPTASIPVVKLSVRADAILLSPDMRAAVMAVRPYQEKEPTLCDLPHLAVNINNSGGAGDGGMNAMMNGGGGNMMLTNNGIMVGDGGSVMAGYGLLHLQQQLQQQYQIQQQSQSQHHSQQHAHMPFPAGMVDPSMFAGPTMYSTPTTVGAHPAAPSSATGSVLGDSAGSGGSGDGRHAHTSHVPGATSATTTAKVNRLRSPSIDSTTNSTSSAISTPTCSTPMMMSMTNMSSVMAAEDASAQSAHVPPLAPQQMSRTNSNASSHGGNSSHPMGHHNAPANLGRSHVSTPSTPMYVEGAMQGHGMGSTDAGMLDPTMVPPATLYPGGYYMGTGAMGSNFPSNYSSPASSGRTSFSSNPNSNPGTVNNGTMYASFAATNAAQFMQAAGVTIPVDITIEGGEHRGIPTCEFIKAKLEKTFILKPVIKVRYCEG
jgi:hypothetical protein